MWRTSRNRDAESETGQTPITINPCPRCGQAHHYVLETRSSTAKRRWFKPRQKAYAGRWPCPSGGIFELTIPVPGSIEWAGAPALAESGVGGSANEERTR
jgi:hypothetical protein